MPKFIETYSMDIDMREDLMEAYRNVLPNCFVQNDAWKLMAKHPAKRYYINSERATATLLKRMFLDKDFDTTRITKNKKRKMECLWNEVVKVSEEPRYAGKTLTELVRIAVKRPAPSFFLSEATIAHIYYNIKNNKYDSDGKLRR